MEKVKMSKEKILCFHHNDLDGLTSAAIVRKKYPVAEFYEIDYDYKVIRELQDFDKIIIVDFSFHKKDFEEIVNNFKGEIIWIDHHKTPSETMPELWNSKDIKGLREIDGDAGCALTWKYFYPTEIIPNVVKWVGDRDTWTFKYPQTKQFCESANLMLPLNDIDMWDKLFENDMHYENEYINQGKLLLEVQKHRVKKAFEQGREIIFHRHKTRLCNSHNDVSEIGAYCLEQGYDIGMIFSMINKELKVDLRSKNVDVSKIAEMHKGGGHRTASGFIIKGADYELDKLIGFN